jgi:hypothetical protein
MSRYQTLDDYTRDVTAARDAYAADQAVVRGLCGTCQQQPLVRRQGRVCWKCAELARGAA